MKASKEYTQTSAVMPELKSKIENLLEVLCGTIITFPQHITEIVKIVTIECTMLFDTNKIFSII